MRRSVELLQSFPLGYPRPFLSSLRSGRRRLARKLRATKSCQTKILFTSMKKPRLFLRSKIPYDQPGKILDGARGIFLRVAKQQQGSICSASAGEGVIMPPIMIPNADDWTNAGTSGDVAIGAQIRELRKVKGLTLRHVAHSANISVGYLSLIERNQTKLPIGVLKKISDTLGVHMNWFFHVQDAPPHEKDIVVRSHNRRRLSFTGIGIEEELLSPNLSGPLEMLLSTIEPGADSGDYNHDGAECGLVVSGRLDLWVAGQFLQLEEGDSFSFKSTEIHRCANSSDKPTKVVWVITPPHY